MDPDSHLYLLYLTIIFKKDEKRTNIFVKSPIRQICEYILQWTSKYSQVLITGRLISGKSLYPDKNMFGYRTLWLLYKVRFGLMTRYPDRILNIWENSYSIRSDLDLLPISGPNIRISSQNRNNFTAITQTMLLYKVRLFDMLWYPDQISGYRVINWSSGYRNPVLS